MKSWTPKRVIQHRHFRRERIFFSSIGRFFAAEMRMLEFTIKEALIITPYPGASAEEVAQEVTNPIESAFSS